MQECMNFTYLLWHAYDDNNHRMSWSSHSSDVCVCVSVCIYCLSWWPSFCIALPMPYYTSSWSIFSSSIFLSNYLSIYPSHTLVNIIWIRYEHMSLLFRLLIFCRFVYTQQWKSIIPCPVINKPPHRISSHIVFIPHWRCVSTVCCVCYYLYLLPQQASNKVSCYIVTARFQVFVIRSPVPLAAVPNASHHHPKASHHHPAHHVDIVAHQYHI